MKHSMVVMSLMLLSLCLSQVTAVTIECKYESNGWFRANEGDLYSCRVQNSDIFNTGEHVHIDGVTGQHETNKTNLDVQGIKIRESPNMGKFPTGLACIFPNIVGISVIDNKLKEITREDLSHFPKLKYLWLTVNQLTHLREDLFEHNKHLEVLCLYNNDIVHIDRKTFSDLNELTFLDVGQNYCQLGGESHTREEIEKVFKRVEAGECQSDTYTTSSTTQNPRETKIQQLKAELEVVSEKKSVKQGDNTLIKIMTAKVKELETQLETLIKKGDE